MERSGTHTVEALAGPERRRVIGRAGGVAPGPTLIVVAGIHGNEHAGLAAAARVLGRIEREGVPLAGRLALLAGNLGALAGRTRFVEDDLNRSWTPERVARLTAGEDETVEDRERRELIAAMDEEVRVATGRVHVVDLHTSSAAGPPFLTVGDTLGNRRFARSFPLPLILGLEEQIDGSLLEFLNECGFVTLGVEAGQHDGPESVDRHEAVLWIALAAAGLVEPDAIADLARFRARLEQASRGLPRVIEVVHRHPIEAADGFVMDPGFGNFDPVRRRQRLARDRRGEVRAPEDGLILLPLYQGKGDDGFFVAREVRPVWLGVSAALRRARLQGLVRHLPGVRAHPDPARRDVLVADTRIARWVALQVFHLFGWRKLRRAGSSLVVSRRRHDVAPPARPSFPPSGSIG